MRQAFRLVSGTCIQKIKWLAMSAADRSASRSVLLSQGVRTVAQGTHDNASSNVGVGVGEVSSKTLINLRFIIYPAVKLINALEIRFRKTRRKMSIQGR